MKTIKMGMVLAVFCVISSGLLAYVYIYTKPTIAVQESVIFENSLREVLPGALTFHTVTAESGVLYMGMNEEQGIGYAVEVVPRGYGGEIKILVGISLKGKICGIKVLSQNETAGLGTNVVKPDFLKQFLEKSLADPLEAKKDIKAITGATISSRAVCRGVREALQNIDLKEKK